MEFTNVHEVEIRNARNSAQLEDTEMTIHDLIPIYTRYIAFMERIIDVSVALLQQAEVGAFEPAESEYARLLRQELNIQDDTKSEKNGQDAVEEAQLLAGFALLSYYQSVGETMAAFPLFDDAFAGVAREGVFNTDRRVWYPQLKEAYKTLCKPVFSSSPNIADHLLFMSSYLNEHKPDPAGSWENGVLQGNEAFDATFERFQLLGAQFRFPKDDSERKLLIRGSAQMLREACSDLLLDWKAADIEWQALVDPGQRPTYVSVPITDPTFAAGRVTTSLQNYLRGILAAKYALGCDPAQDSQANAGATKANSSKRRAAGDASEGPSAKRQQTGTTTTTTTATTADAQAQLQEFQRAFDVDRARADVDLLQRHAGLQEPTCGHDPVLTPLVPYRDATLRAYQKDLRGVVATARGLRGRVLADVAAAADEGATRELLALLEGQAERARTDVCMSQGKRNSGALKQRRIAAFRLVYYRALAVLLVAGAAARGQQARVAADPRVADDLDQQHVRRFRDWVMHEEAWNAADRYAIGTMGVNDPQSYRDRIQNRDANIALWNSMAEALRAPAGSAKKGAKTAPKASAAAPYIKEEEPVADHPAAEAEEGVAQKARLTEEDTNLLATQYTRTILTNRRFHERRMDHIYQNKTDSRGPNGEDTFARGGPPGYKGLPTATAWDKLQYMIVLTHWRFHQAFECRL
ncbi:hypothetical protein PG999_007546 [Apiospora kogelbergensis]|uniref:Uncharacterized protein n=1 Tax=Apiospora kogelbergensis TaxID=1337665 RepID=A0AAW0QNB8_9PEZI